MVYSVGIVFVKFKTKLPFSCQYVPKIYLSIFTEKRTSKIFWLKGINKVRKVSMTDFFLVSITNVTPIKL